MLKIKEYARLHNVSYEAVRKQIHRYRNELQGHIKKVNRTQFLDEWAIDFLNQKRQDNPVVIIQSNKDEELHQLRDENKQLLLKVATLQEQLLNEKDQVKLLQEEKIELLQTSSTKKSWFKLWK